MCNDCDCHEQAASCIAKLLHCHCSRLMTHGKVLRSTFSACPHTSPKIHHTKRYFWVGELLAMMCRCSQQSVKRSSCGKHFGDLRAPGFGLRICSRHIIRPVFRHSHPPLRRPWRARKAAFRSHPQTAGALREYPADSSAFLATR